MKPESHETSPALASVIWWRRYPAVPRSVPVARHHASRLLADRGVPEAARSTAELLVSELVTNAVRHGRVPGRLLELRMTYDLEKIVTVEVSDAGDRRPPVAPPDDSTDDVAESGRGLALVAAFADSWGVRDREVGKTVWARLIVEPVRPDPTTQHSSPHVSDASRRA
ncbi:ATP-binding protein [Streptomyces sp. TR06-5]|uniref:ATP-binding protein n=1 Tax=Streptomyces sp. TR06-5 TaxID=3385976 RepID=UPI0039A0E200